VTPLTFQALTGRRWPPPCSARQRALEHWLWAGSDAWCWPGHGQSRGKMAQGSAMICSPPSSWRRITILVCPAMNCEMWPMRRCRERGPAPDRGLTVLRRSRELACGATGYAGCRRWRPSWRPGEVSDPQDLTGRHILVTAGLLMRIWTGALSHQPLQRQAGLCLAKVPAPGREVCLISGPSHLSSPYGVERFEVRSAGDAGRGAGPLP